MQVLEPRLLLTAEVEPNNTLATATIFAGPSDTLTGRNDILNDIDHFRTSLASGDTLRFSSPNFFPTIEILNAAGEVKASTFDGHHFSYAATTAGTYTLRLTAHSTFGSIADNYSIVADIDSYSGTTETEGNNTQATATDLPGETNFRGSLGSAGDVDFFSFSATAGQAIAVKFAEKPTANPAIRLYSPAGALLTTNRTGLGLTTIVATTGTFAVAIQSDNLAGTVTGAYVGQLLIATEPTQDAETGNGFESATGLDLGPHVVPSLYLSPDTSFSSHGLTGRYINQNLRGAAENNWQATYTIAGTRLDQLIHFPQNDWGNRDALSLFNGNNDNWDDFSVQWDGFLRIVTPGTQIYTASDDGSRMWIDLNGDGVFDSSGAELVANNWGNGQGNTLGTASVGLATGDYQIRIQYEEGGGDNNAYLLWSDAAHSAGAVSRNNHQDGVGSLASLSDVDVYAVNLTGTGFYEFRLEATSGGLTTQNRVVTLYNEFGQPLEYDTVGRVATDNQHVRPETTSRYFVTVQATNETGLGPYVLVARIDREFPIYRDIPLFYTHYESYTKPEHVPQFDGFVEAFYDIYQVDMTNSDPGGGLERVEWQFNNVDSGCGGLGGGGYGYRRVSGGAGGNCGGADWNRLADPWFGLSFHEIGHGVGLPHARHPLSTMSYSNQYEYLPIGSYNRIAGDARIPVPKIQNERNYLDWVLEAGRIVLEDESNDDLASAQRLNSFFGEMTTDADPRNDQVVVVGGVATPTDTDVFRFTAAANETYSIDIDAAEFQYPLDSRLEILNGSGTVLATNQGGIDRDTGFASVDPFLVYQFATAGDYYARVRGELGTTGNYRLKVTPQRAFDQTGSRVLASWPDGGSTVDGTRQLIFWFNDQLDPATLTSTNIVVTGQSSGTRAGSGVFDPITSTLTWRANTVLPPDTYTITLRGGAGGITDLRGNRLDGETDGVPSWPEVSGNGTAGGDFTSTFTINQTDTTPAAVYWAPYSRHPHDRGLFEMFFDDELDVLDVYSKTITLRGAGPDHTFSTADDTFSPVDVIYDRIGNTSDHALRVYSRGVLDQDSYRIEASLLDAAGNTVLLSQVFDEQVPIPASSLFTTPAKATGGLVGSYVNQSLRAYAPQDDWTKQPSITIAGTRTDSIVDFTNDSFGVRSQVGITGGNDANWDNFSTQWDGVVVIPANGVRLFTRSDDGSRMWIDVNDDGVFNSSGSEFVNNNWGNGQGTTTGPASVALNAGTYRIRMQYEEGDGGNQMQLLWNYAGTLAPFEGIVANPKVVDVSVQPNTVLTTPPALIDVTFSQSITTATLTTSSFRVRYSPDSTFFDANDTYLAESNGAIAWSPTLRKATFQPATTLVNGYYLIELDGDAGGIASLSGRLLDGEYRDTNIAGNISQYGWNDSPSGDGLPGGDYRAMFVVSAPQLLVDIPIASFPENGGSAAAVGIVTRRYTDLSAPLTVSLATSDTTEATVPATITIPAGQASATFNIAAIDDTLLDNTQVVTMTASAASFQSGSDMVSVTDFEPLAVTINLASISENGGSATGTVTRSNSDINSALTVTLSSNDTTEATVPATITILANQASASFTIAAADDALLDGTQTVTITASATGYVAGSANLNVMDLETLTVAINLASISEIGGSATGTVTRSNSDINSALTVTLSSNDTTEATVPATITIPANRASATFAITAADDVLLDGTQTVTIMASATGYVAGSANLNVMDLETLAVTINPASISENGGSATGTVTRSNTDISSALTVTLSSNDTTEATVPATITILANQASATFAITAADDALLDGTQTVTITASATGYVGGSANVNLTDFETLALTINPASISENGGVATGTVTRSNTDISSALTVTLASNDTTEATVPATITILANQASATFAITGADDALLDGTQTVTITASSLGFAAGNAMVDVTDDENQPPTISDIVDQSTSEDTPTAALAFTVGDLETAAGSLTVTASSSNTALVPDGNLVLGGSGASRTLTITPTENQSGISTIMVTVTDAGGIARSDTFVLTVNAMNDAPVIGAFDTTITYTENEAAVLMDTNATVIDIDSANLDIGTLTFSLISNVESADRMEIVNQGTSSGQIGASGTTVTFGGTAIGTFTGGLGTGDLVVALNENATPAAVQALLRNVTYRSISESPSTAPRTVRATVTDGDGATSNQPTKTLNVTAVNDAPTALTLPTTSIAENQPSGTTVGTFGATDPDSGDTFSYALVAGIGSTNNASFTISGSFLKTGASFDFETKSSYTIRVKVTDAGGLTFEKQFTITVTDVVEGIVIISPAAFTTAQRPVFSWTAVTGATLYETWVNKAPSTLPFDKATVTQASYTPSRDFGIGKFYLWVRSITNGVASLWTPPYTFVINTAATIHPIIRSQPTLRPTISWDVLPGAVKYDVLINDISRGTLQYIRNSSVTGTNFTASAAMPMGVYRAWVRGIAADGTSGNWSGAVEFLTMQAPTITAPLNSTFSQRPVFTWNPIAGATTYELQIRNRTTGAITYNPTGLTAANWTPPANLPNGPYRWWVIAVGPNGLRGFWTAPVDFSIGGDTALLTPIGTISNRRPTFTWKTVDGAVRYELWVTNLTLNTRPVDEKSLTTTSYTPPSSLATGTYRAWVRAVSASGTFGQWSPQADFVIAHVEPNHIDLLASSISARLITRDVLDLQLYHQDQESIAIVPAKHSLITESPPVLTPSDVDETLYDAVMEELTHLDFTS